MSRPDFCTEEHLTYLDELRESGITNMYGAANYLCPAFRLDAVQGRDVLGYWMRTFSERHPSV